MMRVLYSRRFHGWVICEVRQIGDHVVDVPISTPYSSEELAIDAMHTIYAMRQALK